MSFLSAVPSASFKPPVLKRSLPPQRVAPSAMGQQQNNNGFGNTNGMNNHHHHNNNHHNNFGTNGGGFNNNNGGFHNNHHHNGFHTNHHHNNNGFGNNNNNGGFSHNAARGDSSNADGPISTHHQQGGGMPHHQHQRRGMSLTYGVNGGVMGGIGGENSNNGGNGGSGTRPLPTSVAPLGAAPVGLSPGLGPSNPSTLLAMPSTTIEAPMYTPIAKDRPSVSEESIRTREYTRAEFMSLRGECTSTPSAVLEWILGMYRTDGGVGSLRCPPHLRLLVDELEADRTGALLGTGRKTARPVRAVHHKVMSILSRLTPQKYDLLKDELFQLPLKQLSDSELREVVKVFFNKSVQEHKFSDLYAHLVADICTMTEAESALDQATRERLLQTRMRSELLTACQEEFNRPLQLTEKDRVDPITGDPLPEEEIARKREILKTRLVGNIKFVGELYKFHLVNPRVVNSIFRILIFDFTPQDPTAKEDYMFEVFGMLLKTVAIRMCREDPAIIEEVMKMVQLIQENHKVNRVRFIMMDLNDLHRKGWPDKKEVMTQQEHDNAQIEKAARESATLDRQKAQLRSGVPGNGSSSNLSTPVSQMDSGKFGSNPGSTTKRANALGGLSSATATPIAPRSTFPPPPSSPLAAGAANYAAVAGGRKIPGSNPTITTTTTRAPTTPSTPNALGGSLNNSRSNAPPPPPAAAGGNSATTSPVHAVSRDSVRETALRLMASFNDDQNRPAVLKSLRELERQVCIPVITTWIRESVILTKNFTMRDNLPLLFYAIVECCENRAEMILSSSDLLATVLEWIRFDTDQGRFNECPRYFANWASVVQKAFTYAVQATGTRKEHWLRVLSVINCSTFTLTLREIVTKEYRSAIATALRDMNQVASQVTLMCDQLAGREPTKILSFAALSRFRLLPYVIKADDGDRIRIPHTPSLGPAPSLSIDHGPVDPYHECFQIQQDDAELNLFKRVVRRDPKYIDVIINALDGIQSGQNVTRLAIMMKLTAATLSLLNPPTAEKPLINEEEANTILKEAITRAPYDLQPIAQAAVVMEMVCFYCSNTNKLWGISSSPSPSIGAAPNSPGKMTRDESAVALNATAETFRRWCEAGVVDRSAVLAALQSVAPIAVPSTPGTPPRMSSAALDAMDNSFSLPEPQHRVSTPLMGASTGSCPSTPQINARGGGGAPPSFRFDQCEMLVRNMNFISSLKWHHVLSQLQK